MSEYLLSQFLAAYFISQIRQKRRKNWASCHQNVIKGQVSIKKNEESLYQEEGLVFEQKLFMGDFQQTMT
jgi:hypothetical protein